VGGVEINDFTAEKYIWGKMLTLLSSIFKIVPYLLRVPDWKGFVPDSIYGIPSFFLSGKHYHTGHI
jgi:hypothetical protein